MDAGLEISANQMNILVHQSAMHQCQLNVMLIAMYVTWEVVLMDAGWETFVNLQMFLVQ